MANSRKRVSFSVRPEVWRRFEEMCEKKNIGRTPRMQLEVLVQVFAAGFLDDGLHDGWLTEMFVRSWERLGLTYREDERTEQAATLADRLWDEIGAGRKA